MSAACSWARSSWYEGLSAACSTLVRSRAAVAQRNGRAADWPVPALPPDTSPLRHLRSSVKNACRPPGERLTQGACRPRRRKKTSGNDRSGLAHQTEPSALYIFRLRRDACESVTSGSAPAGNRLRLPTPFRRARHTSGGARLGLGIDLPGKLIVGGIDVHAADNRFTVLRHRT